jgi:hypothetical protein
MNRAGEVHRLLAEYDASSSVSEMPIEDRQAALESVCLAGLIGGERGIRTLLTRGAKYLMARDFWPEGFEDQRLQPLLDAECLEESRHAGSHR